MKLHTTSRLTCSLLTAALALASLQACSSGDEPGRANAQPTTRPMDGFKDAANIGAIYADPQRDPKALAAQGEKLIGQYRGGSACTACHDLGKSESKVGPSLKGLAQRYTRAFDNDALKTRVWLHNKVADSQSFPGLATKQYAASGSAMPKLAGLFTSQEIEAIVEYLMAKE
jgi:cytochrome c2